VTGLAPLGILTADLVLGWAGRRIIRDRRGEGKFRHSYSWHSGRSAGHTQIIKKPGMQSLAGATWKLIEARALDDAGDELPPPLGPQPMGIVIFGGERMMVGVGDGRTSLPPDDGASSPDLLRDQVRHIEFEGTARFVATPVSGLARNAGLRLVWERVG
jgi:hypothetical protein